MFYSGVDQFIYIIFLPFLFSLPLFLSLSHTTVGASVHLVIQLIGMTKSDGQPLLARSTRAALRTPLLLLLFLLLLLVRLPLAANGARMLMFVPNLSYSHVAFNAKIADTLAGDGHNVVSGKVFHNAVEKCQVQSHKEESQPKLILLHIIRRLYRKKPSEMPMNPPYKFTQTTIINSYNFWADQRILLKCCGNT